MEQRRESRNMGRGVKAGRRERERENDEEGEGEKEGGQSIEKCEPNVNQA